MITGKKTGKGEEADDKQLIALLRSQILTYQSENEQLKQKQLQVNIFCKVSHYSSNTAIVNSVIHQLINLSFVTILI
jgi:hypothetical protein